MGKKLYKLTAKANPLIIYDNQGKKIEKDLLEYPSGQLFMSISYIILCL
jgi:hypothetical protein